MHHYRLRYRSFLVSLTLLPLSPRAAVNFHIFGGNTAQSSEGTFDDEVCSPAQVAAIKAGITDAKNMANVAINVLMLKDMNKSNGFFWLFGAVARLIAVKMVYASSQGAPGKLVKRSRWKRGRWLSSKGIDIGTTPQETYLWSHFKRRLQIIVDIRSSPCGTAYRHCTEEKHFVSICTSLGINLSAPQFAPVTVPNGLSISYDDVVRASGLRKATLAGILTYVGKAREARRQLARLIRQQTVPSNEQEAFRQLERRELLETLDVLLQEGDIDESPRLQEDDNLATARAFAMNYERFKADTKKVLDGNF
ncbi:hypothetical protein B0H14DRAFT_3429672 [Mycena olivaceomarginata]|nr:hypothetical protein B0H14DRAFT_3429672 [Mycena olivaceomarginata]